MSEMEKIAEELNRRSEAHPIGRTNGDILNNPGVCLDGYACQATLRVRTERLPGRRGLERD